MTDHTSGLGRLIKTGGLDILPGMVGLERESLNRAAGFRTHVLVEVGSALVMLVSVGIFELYKNRACGWSNLSHELITVP